MLEIGQSLSHYNIVEKIGQGGMGVVYRAHDENLDRDVALKILSPGTLSDKSSQRRLRKEARALSKLNHPNIEFLFELNALENMEFLVVEYIAGTTLSDLLVKGALPEKEVTRLGVQLAEGLAAAHDQEIVHCDIKPGNLRIKADGRLKILDFGIAKLSKSVIALSTTDSTPDSSSNTPAIGGTLPYMSPEQLQGECVDRRSDIYAAGAVLYEMATGQQPFHEETTPRLIDAILNQVVVPPRVVNGRISPDLERIILKCLEKDPEDRYHAAQELEIDLRRLSAPKTLKPLRAESRAAFRRQNAAWGAMAALVLTSILLVFNVGDWRQKRGGIHGGGIDSVAVLPLKNLSNDSEQDYFADGLTEELITKLGKIKALRIISRTSAMMYKEAKKPLVQIARELGVSAVVEGTVFRSDNRVRITAQLIQAEPERTLWSESYERDMRDILTLQSEVALAIVRGIQLKLDPQEELRLLEARAMEPRAYEAYLRGRYYWNQRSPEAVLTGLRYFEEAVNSDPSYGLAYSGIADSYAIMGVNAWLLPRDAVSKAKAAARKALENGNSLGEAHASMAQILELEWDWSSAEVEYKTALALNPGYATAHQWYSALLSLMGRHKDAMREAQRALQLDPLSPIISLNMGQILYFARQYKEAQRSLMNTHDLSPGFFLAQYFLGLVHLQDHRFAESIAVLREAAQLSHGDDMPQAALGFVYALAGRKQDAQQALEELKMQAAEKYVSPCHFALICAGLGRDDEAFDWLETAYRQKSIELPSSLLDPMLDSLRSDPRFNALCRQIKLPNPLLSINGLSLP